MERPIDEEITSAVVVLSIKNRRAGMYLGLRTIPSEGLKEGTKCSALKRVQM